MPSTIMSARAVPGGGEDLAGVQEPLGIEGVFQTKLEIDQLGGLLEVQIRRLHDADAVLAGKRAAHGDDVAKQLLDALLDARLVGGIVPQEIDVQVAIA